MPAVPTLTPILVAEEIEACADFWSTRLGYAKTVEIPHGGRLGFVILEKDGAEIMYESPAVLATDLPQLAGLGTRALLYVEVENLEEIESAMAGLEPVVPMRQTSYGAAELAYADPAGNVIIFSMNAGY